MRLRLAALFFALIALVLDQVTKLHSEATFLSPTGSPPFASRHLPGYPLFSLGVPPLRVQLGQASPDAITPSWLSIELAHVSNRGITFGLLETSHPVVPVLAFYGTTLSGILLGAFILRKARPQSWLLRAGGLLLMTGVIANLIDRLRFGYVIDWLVIAWSMSSWQVELPAFNFGDSYIAAAFTLLAAGLILDRLRSARGLPPASSARPE